jgi:hypothetical protein
MYLLAVIVVHLVLLCLSSLFRIKRTFHNERSQIHTFVGIISGLLWYLCQLAETENAAIYPDRYGISVS